jgi:hypothetical protein
MTFTTAQLILAVIASVAVTTWLAGSHYLANSPAKAAKRDRTELEWTDRESTLVAGPTTIIGEGEIAGDRDALSTKLAAKIARDGIWPGGPIEIVESRDGRLEFVSPGEPANPRGQIHLESAGTGRTRYEYEVEYRALARLLKIGWIIQGAGLVVLAVAYWALHTWIAPAANPAIWAQSFQLIQVVHLLWPPFMLGHRYRSQYGQVRRQMDTLLRNLPHAAV